MHNWASANQSIYISAKRCGFQPCWTTQKILRPTRQKKSPNLKPLPKWQCLFTCVYKLNVIFNQVRWNSTCPVMACNALWKLSFPPQAIDRGETQNVVSEVSISIFLIKAMHIAKLEVLSTRMMFWDDQSEHRTPGCSCGHANNSLPLV
jgi:hypothetical protein